MKLVSKESPFSYLYIIVIEIGIGILATLGGLAIDFAIYDPPKDQPSFMFPLFTGIFMMLSAAIIFISFIIVLIRIIYLYVKQNTTTPS